MKTQKLNTRNDSDLNFISEELQEEFQTVFLSLDDAIIIE